MLRFTLPKVKKISFKDNLLTSVKSLLEMITKVKRDTGSRAVVLSLKDENYIRQGVRNIEGVQVTFDRDAPKAYTISRLEVPVQNRRKGLCSKTMSLIVKEADRRGITLYANICPDGYPKDKASWDIADGLLKVCDRNGFKSFVSDGHVYRNDKSRQPKRSKL